MASEQSEAMKQFQELQAKYVEITQKHKQLVTTIMQKKQDIHRSALTRHELEPLPAGVGCYKGFGRSFVREDKSAIMTGLEEIARASDEEIKKSEGQKDYLQKALAETESNLKELLQGNEALSRELLQSGAIQ